MFKTIVFLTSFSIAYGSDEIKWYLPVDLWSNYPINHLAAYDRIQTNEEIFFYSDPSMSGKPVAKVVYNVFFDLSSSKSCRYESNKHKAKLKSWITCIPYQCNEIKHVVPESIIINEPAHPKWMASNDEFVSCSFQLDFTILNDYSFSMILPAGKRDFSYQKKKIYPDIRFCSQKEKASRCQFNLKSQENDFSLAFRKKHARRFPPLSFYIRNKDCLKKIDSIRCLDSITLNAADIASFSESFGYRIKKVNWSQENIQELKSCLTEGSQIDDFNYRGIKKKCLRTTNSKIAVIDYPEAFMSGQSEDNRMEYSNFLKP